MEAKERKKTSGVSRVVDQWSGVVRPQTPVNKERGEKASSEPATEEEVSAERGGGRAQHPENSLKFIIQYLHDCLVFEIEGKGRREALSSGMLHRDGDL